MQLTQDMVDRYVGGQIEIQNQIEGYIYRGEIETITVTDANFEVKLTWMAKGEGYPPLPHRWVNDDELNYGLSTLMMSVAEIGDNRLCITSVVSSETIVLFPPDGSKLDPSKVEGLQIAGQPA